MRRKRLMWILLLAPVIIYLLVCAGLYFGQTALLFPTGQVGPADPLPPAAERLELAAASGERLHGVHISASRPGPERLLLLGFAGNAWNAQSAATFIAGLAPEADVIVFHYRGYRPSEGRANAEALLADAPRILDFARARVRPARAVAVGFSIGAGVAASLATQRQVDGLILVTPFDSLGRVAAGHYPWLPVRLLFRHPMEPAAELAGKDIPVALIAAGDDTLIPPTRTDGLRRGLSNIVLDRVVAGVGHNDIYHHSDFDPAFREALVQIIGRR